MQSSEYFEAHWEEPGLQISLLIGENPGHVTFIYKKSCDNITVAHCFPFAKGSNGILV